MESSPLLRNSSFLKRDASGAIGDTELSPPSSDELLFKDYLKQQIDHLMTGDAGRDGVAEGRRGTHVEVGIQRTHLNTIIIVFGPAVRI